MVVALFYSWPWLLHEAFLVWLLPPLLTFELNFLLVIFILIKHAFLLVKEKLRMSTTFHLYTVGWDCLQKKNNSIGHWSCSGIPDSDSTVSDAKAEVAWSLYQKTTQGEIWGGGLLYKVCDFDMDDSCFHPVFQVESTLVSFIPKRWSFPNLTKLFLDGHMNHGFGGWWTMHPHQKTYEWVVYGIIIWNSLVKIQLIIPLMLWHFGGLLT